MKSSIVQRFSYRWLTEKPLKLPIDKTRIILFFLLINYIIVFVDVTIAHALNRFFPSYELIPIVYTPLAALTVLLLLIFPKRGWPKNLNIFMNLLGIFIGIIGFAFHLQGASAGNTVTYAALTSGNPIFAPLAFIGLGSIGVIVSLDDKPNLRKYSMTQKTRWLLLATAFWFFATGLVAHFDHARTGFTNLFTWIPYYVGIFSALITLFQAYSQPNKGLSTVFGVTMLLCLITGLMGFAFHLSADLAGRGNIIWSKIFYQAPALGPLLFSDLGIWGALVFLDPLPEDYTSSSNISPTPSPESLA